MPRERNEWLREMRDAEILRLADAGVRRKLIAKKMRVSLSRVGQVLAWERTKRKHAERMRSRDFGGAA